MKNHVRVLTRKEAKTIDWSTNHPQIRWRCRICYELFDDPVFAEVHVRHEHEEELESNVFYATARIAWRKVDIVEVEQNIVG